MTDESRKAWTGSFGSWLQGRDGKQYQQKELREAYFAGWSARDAEITALKARVEELEKKLNYWRDKAKDALR